MIKKKLPQEWYDLLKELDFSEIKNDIVFNDDQCEFETSNEDFDLVFNDNIVAKGMDENQNRCTEYGRRLYMLYDLIFFTDEEDQT